MARKQDAETQDVWPAGGVAVGGLGFLPAPPGAGRKLLKPVQKTGPKEPDPASPSEQVADNAEPARDTEDVPHRDLLNRLELDTVIEPDLADTEEIEPMHSSQLNETVRSLADRVGRPQKAKSALEVLRASQNTKRVALNSEPINVKATRKKTVPFPTQNTGQANDVNVLLQSVLGEHEVLREWALGEASIMRVLWDSHRSRAQSTGDVQLAVAAHAILVQLQQGLGLHLYIAEVQVRGERYAVWIDRERSAVLAALKPAEVYLAGLKTSV